MFKFLLFSTLGVAYSVVENSGCYQVLDFNDLTPGSYVHDLTEKYGVTVTAIGKKTRSSYTPDSNGVHQRSGGAAMVFDTLHPTGSEGQALCSGNDGDEDLGSPNEKCTNVSGPKPGVGEGGEPLTSGGDMNPYANCEPLGNVLIIQEKNKSCPDDTRDGGWINFDFTDPVSLKLAKLLDVDEGKTPEITVTYDDNGTTKEAKFTVTGTGENGVATEYPDVDNVSKVSIEYWGSGSIASLEYIPSTCTNEVALSTEATMNFKGSSSGDPHFKTWNGDKYDYHGECDLVLLYNPYFSNGKGLRIHIRTTRVNYYSYIETVAVQIGNETLEFSNDVENFLINGVNVERNQRGIDTLLSEFLVRRDHKAISIRLNKSSKEKNRVDTRKEKCRIDLIHRKTGFPAVVVNSAGTDILNGSLGMLGEFGTGRMVARDGVTVIGDPEEFAMEWQVQETEPMIFSTARYPQHPTLCTPPAKALTNRLGSSLARMEAEKICANWKEDIEDCIFDVIATRDAAAAEEGHHGDAVVA